MKKNYPRRWAGRTLSLTFMNCLLVTLLCLFQSPLQAKDSLQKEVTLSVTEEPLKKVLNEIEQKTGYVFFYLSHKVDVARKVSINVEKAPLSLVLNKLFDNTNVSYQITGNQIILKANISSTPQSKDSIERNGILEDNDVSPQIPGLRFQAPESEHLVTGTIVDDKGDALPGVNVLVTGTTIGTSSDADGKYQINVPDDNVSLTFSFIGYVPQTISVSGRSTIDVTLLPDIQTLNEVVVVGYGTTSKRAITGAVTSVKSKDLVAFQAVTPDAMMQGQGTGIQVSQANGAPGSPVRVIIRGTSSISAGTEPLWVIDGIPVSNDVSGIGGSNQGAINQNPLASINPNDIASIEVLKDAAATAIYGSRGSSGVVLVTTKSGKGSTGSSITVDMSYGVTSPTKDPADMGFANAEEWLQIVNLSRQNAGLPTTIQENLGALPAVNAGPSTLTPEQFEDNFWFDEILRTGSFQEFNLSTTRGFERGNIFISGNYRNDVGVLKNNDFQRLSFRINAEYEPIRNLTTGIRLALSHTKNERALNGGAPSGNVLVASGGFGSAATGALPILPVYNEDGEYFNPTSGVNLAATTDRDLFRDEVLLYRALGGIYAEYRVPFLEGLSLRTELSADLSYNDNLFWASDKLRPTGINYASTSNSFNTNINYNLLLKYDRNFGDDHRINVVVGTESQETYARSTNLFGEGIPGGNQDFGNPTLISRSPSAGLGGERYLRSYLGRFDYSFKNRYLLGGSFRSDGSSVFLKGNRWSNFPALSAGWIFSEEAFMSGLNFIDFAKIKASVGQTGNQSIPGNASFTGFANWPRYGGADQAYVVNNIATTDLVWEKTTAYDVALELNLLNDRIMLSAGYYHKDVSDLLVLVPVAPSVGLFDGSRIWSNVADLRSNGFEFSVQTVNVDRGKFRWTSSINLTTNHNKILSIVPELDESGNGISNGMTRNISGKSLSTFYTAEYAGIDSRTGMPMIYEIDRDLFAATGKTVRTGNVLPATTQNIQNHRILQDDKTGLPTHYGGITNTFAYGGLDLTVVFSFQGGNYLYNSAEIGATWVGQGGNNLYKDLLTDSWTPENPTGKYPRLMWNNSFNINNDGNPNYNADGTPNNNVGYAPNAGASAIDRYLYKGDYIRLRTLQLGYTFKPEMLQRIGIKNLRATFSANNILTFTRFPGWDPEQLNTDSNSESRNLSQGIVNNTLPPLKTYSAGLSITF